MLRPLYENRASVYGRGSLKASWYTFYEVPVASRGVADILHVAIDDSYIEKRKQADLPPIIDWWELTTFARMQQEPQREWTAFSLADAIGMSVEGLRRGALRRLLRSGHINRNRNGSFAPTWPYQDATKRIVSIEAKRSNWKGAASQAARYCWFSDYVYLALEPPAANRAAKDEQWLKDHGIGVVSVDPRKSQVKKLRSAPRSTRLHHLYRAAASEYILHLIFTGQNSGPVSPVFGRDLTASHGEDLRSTVSAQVRLCQTDK